MGVALGTLIFVWGSDGREPSGLSGQGKVRDPSLLGSGAFFRNSIKDAVSGTRLPFNPTPCQKLFDHAWAIGERTGLLTSTNLQVLHKLALVVVCVSDFLRHSYAHFERFTPESPSSTCRPLACAHVISRSS